MSDPADPLLDTPQPEVRPLVQELRMLIPEVMPEATEKVRRGWSAIHYGLGGTMRDVVAALSPQRSYVNLEFSDGVELPDPAHRLEGTGKRLRHVKIRTHEDVHDPAVRTLLEEASRRRGPRSNPGVSAGSFVVPPQDDSQGLPRSRQLFSSTFTP